VGSTWQGYDAESVAYLVKDMDGAQIWNPASELPMMGVPGKGAAFTFFPDQIQYLEPIQALYPGGTHGVVSSKSGVPLMDYYVIPPDVVNHLYGTVVQLFAGGATVPSRVERTSQVGLMPDGVSYPVRARWTALLYITSYSFNSLAVEGASASILVDGQSVEASEKRLLQQGWHQVSVEATLDRPTHLRLMLTAATAQPIEVPHERLWAVPPGSGLLGAVAAQDSTTGPLIRNEQFIGYTALLNGSAPGPQLGGAAPLRARWKGEIDIPVAGQYQFEIRTNGQARLTIGGAVGQVDDDNIEGTVTFGTCPGRDPFPGAANVQLDAGWHPIQFDYITAGSGNTLELSWTKPDGDKSVIPPGMFRFALDDAEGGTTPPTPPEDWTCNAP
jgi:hypothetical protein